jgi:hypothetical protein
MENAMEIREDMEKACVLANLTCNALAPSKISSTTFFEIESPISRSTLLTGESGGLSVPWSVFTLTGGQTHHPSGLAIRKIKFLAIIYIYILTITAHVVCVVRPFLALARREILSLALAYSAFERVRTRFVHKKYAYNCNLKLE